MKRLLIFIVLASALIAAGAMAAPSAKFAAVFGNEGPYLISMVTVEGTVDADDFQQKEGFTFARIKVPNNQELLVGVSAEVGLTTDTSIKGKNGGAAKAIAGASGVIIVVAHRVGDCSPGDNDACGQVALPGDVTLNSRVQTLHAKLGGVIISCSEGAVVIKDDCIVEDEEIGLILETLSANHFNFVLQNLEQGTYDITAYFTTRAEGEIDIDEDSVTAGGTVSARASATAFIGAYMVTLQQVRAVKGELSSTDIDVVICSGSGCD